MVTRIKKVLQFGAWPYPADETRPSHLLREIAPWIDTVCPRLAARNLRNHPSKALPESTRQENPRINLEKKLGRKKNMNPKTLRNSTANLSMPCHPHHPCSLRSSTCLWTWSTATDLSALGTGGGQVVPTVLVVSRPPTTWPIPDQNLCLNHLSGAFQIIVHCKFLSSCAVDECWPQ